jgi:hypothetical protein
MFLDTTAFTNMSWKRQRLELPSKPHNWTFTPSLPEAALDYFGSMACWSSDLNQRERIRDQSVIERVDTWQ